MCVRPAPPRLPPTSAVLASTRPPPFVLACPRRSARSLSQLVAQLYNFTGAKFEVVEDTDDCAVTTITFPGVDGFEFKYVDNKIGHVGEHSLADYDDFLVVQTETDSFPLPLLARAWLRP